MEAGSTAPRRVLSRSRGAPVPVAPIRERILSAVAQLFAEHGFASTSMPAIAEWSGITAGAIYQHFASKAQILGVHAQVSVGYQKGVEECLSFLRQLRLYQTEGFCLRILPRHRYQAFDGRDGRSQNLGRPQTLAGHLEEQRGAVMYERPSEEPVAQVAQVGRRGPPEAKIALNVQQMGTARSREDPRSRRRLAM